MSSSGLRANALTAGGDLKKPERKSLALGKTTNFLRLLRGRTSAPRLLTRAHINFTRRKTSRHKEINLRVNTRTRIVDLSASLASKLLRSLSAKDWSGQTKI